MTSISKIASVLLLIGSACAAQAQSTSSDDAARRARNREEAIAHHNGMPSGSTAKGSTYRPSATDDSARAKTHRAADKTRGFTHRQLTKVRDFGARTDAKFPAPKPGVADSNKSAPALGK